MRSCRFAPFPPTEGDEFESLFKTIRIVIPFRQTQLCFSVELDHDDIATVPIVTVPTFIDPYIHDAERLGTDTVSTPVAAKKAVSHIFRLNVFDTVNPAMNCCIILEMWLSRFLKTVRRGDDPKRMNQNATAKNRFFFRVPHSARIGKPAFLRLVTSLRFMKCQSTTYRRVLH